jgi:hypothetical protein
MTLEAVVFLSSVLKEQKMTLKIINPWYVQFSPYLPSPRLSP